MHDFFSSMQPSDITWGVMTAVISYGVKTLKELNENIKIIVLRVDGHQKTLDDHEDRLRAVE